MRSSVRLLILAQSSLGVLLLVCLLLIPHYLFEADEGGLSNYGVYNRTIVPYTLAFSLCGLLTLQAARVLPAWTVRRRQLWRILVIFGWLCFLVVESTFLYQVGGVLDGIHIAAGMLLVLFETTTALWFGRTFSRDRLQTALLIAQCAGFALSLLTFLGLVHILFIAEVLTSLAFGVVLIRTVCQAVAGEPHGDRRQPLHPG